MAYHSDSSALNPATQNASNSAPLPPVAIPTTSRRSPQAQQPQPGREPAGEPAGEISGKMVREHHESIGLRILRTQPVLVGGLGLSTFLWLWDSLSVAEEATSIGGLGDWTWLSLGAIGAGALWWKSRRVLKPIAAPTIQPTFQAAQQRLQVAIAALHRLEQEWQLGQNPAHGQGQARETAKGRAIVIPSEVPQISQIQAELEILRDRLEQVSPEHSSAPASRPKPATVPATALTLKLVIVGAPLVGKSAIQRVLLESCGSPTTNPSRSTQTQPITIAFTELNSSALDGTVQNSTVQNSADSIQVNPANLANPSTWLGWEQLRSANVVLYAIGGDITASERQHIATLIAQGFPVWVLWNKADLVQPTERAQVLQSIQLQLSDLIPAQQVLAIAAQPRTTAPLTGQVTGQVIGQSIPPSTAVAEFAPLLHQIHTWQTQPGAIVWQQIQRAANYWLAQTQITLNYLRRQRAEAAIQRAQWIAAAATIANPLPNLDLLATGSVSTQLFIELGRIYQRPLSLDRAKTAAATLAELLLKLGLVEISTQAIAAGLKQHPATFLVGGAVQGISAAYWIYVAGMSVVNYFETIDTEIFTTEILTAEILTTTLTAGDLTAATDSDRTSDHSFMTQGLDSSSAQAAELWQWERLRAIAQQTIQTTQRGAFVQMLLKQAQRQLFPIS